MNAIKKKLFTILINIFKTLFIFKEKIIHYLNKYIQDPIYIDNVMSHSVDAVSKLKLEKNPSIMTAKEISNLIDGK